MAKMKVVDRSYQNTILYPALQENEVRLASDPNNSVPLSQEERSYFPLDFRLQDVVLDALAQKYDTTYPELESSDERFLLGPSAIRKRDRSCPYMEKAMDAIKQMKCDNMVAVHLLDTDETASNMQKFLILTKDCVYLRYRTNGIDSYSYDNLRICQEGIENKEGSKIDESKFILEYPLAEEFREYAAEFMLLRQTTLLSIFQRHPMADEPIVHRERYLHFLVDAAASDGKLRADALIYLEYMTRNFHLTADILTKYLEEARQGGFPDNMLNKELNRLFSDVIPTEKQHVFCMDILDMVVGLEGEVCRPKLLDLLRRRTGVVGPDFVNFYLESVKYRRAANRVLYSTLSIVASSHTQREDEYMEELLKRQRYVQEFDEKMLRIGVSINER